MNIDDFISYEQLRGICYTKHLRPYLKPLSTFLEERSLEPGEVRPKDIQEFQTWLTTLTDEDGSMHYAAYTVRTIMSIGKRYFSYLKESGKITANPFLRVKQVQAERKLPHDIPDEKTMNKLLEELRAFGKQKQVREKRLYYRCHVMAEVLYASGLRISELLALKAEDIHFTSGTISVKNGKGGKDRTAYLTEYAAKVLGFYLEEMRDTVIVNRDSPLLFGTKDISTVSATFHKVLKDVAGKEGISHFTTHSFRHTLGYHLLKRGCELRYIQLVLGHEDMNTTTIYTRVAKEDLRGQLDHFHPRTFKERKAG